MEYVTLNNGVKMPKLGYGVYQTPPEETEHWYSVKKKYKLNVNFLHNTSYSH